jgi:preprotein translocase subunit Sec63
MQPLNYNILSATRAVRKRYQGKDKCEWCVHLDLNTIIKSLLQLRNVIIHTFYTLSTHHLGNSL